VRVDDVRPGERIEPKLERMGWVPADVSERSQETDPETAGITARARRSAERTSSQSTSCAIAEPSSIG
jgi:hypothetical protein